MAQKTTVILEDDLDGGPADENIQFGLDGNTYEIDLNEDNAQALRDALAPYMGSSRRIVVAGRRNGKTSASRSTSSTTRRRSDGDSAVIREWARGQGIEINKRGRIPAGVREAYYVGHPK